ncbi:MAG: FAD-dependent oxidoreductase [Dehalococcoidales bacterium]|nr:FAD-dependent oxidoreductase [Dehalococcoidales bacterium]
MMDGRIRYKKLFEPSHIGNVRTRNRIIKTASQTYLFDSGERRVSLKALAFHEAIAKGGVGLLVVETPAMEWPLAETGDRRFRLDNDKYVKDIKVLTDVIHKHGCPAFMQMYHRGPWGGIYRTIAPQIAASPVVFQSVYDVHEETPPREMTIAEIDETVERWVGIAVRAAEAGFDGLELHTGADHLLATFVSRFWNKRTDEYGPQNWENRTRFTIRILREIKKRLGRDYPVMVQMNGVEVGGGPEGMDFDEGRQLAKILEASGADAFHVRSYWFGQHQGSYHHEVLFYPETQIPLKDFPKELEWKYKGPLANITVGPEIKKAVSVPIMIVGGFDADTGEKALREGKTDFIGITRRMFADPEWPNKVAAGRFDDIAPCTHCGECTRLYNEPRRCRINASFGIEQYEVKPAEKKKRVVVVGGGPAGMQAARVAALRGHEVTLYERGYKLGGSLPMASLVKGFEIENIPAIIRYFKAQITRLGVQIKLVKEIDAAEIIGLKPDIVIVALGGKDVIPDIPGIEKKIVVKGESLHKTLTSFLRFFSPQALRWLTKFYMPLGKKVIVIGGDIHGSQLSEFLVKRGRKVTIVDTSDDIGKGLAPERKTRLLLWFRRKGVTLIPSVKYEEITDKGLIISKDGQKQLIEADNIVTSLPLVPDTELVKNLEGKVPEVYAIGDCREPGLIPDATRAGWLIGNQI